MKAQLLKTVRFFYNSYLFLSLIAGLFVWQISVGNSFYALLCSLSVFLTYNALRYFKSKENALTPEVEIWWDSNKRILLTIMIGVSMSIIVMIFLDFNFLKNHLVEFGIAVFSLALYHVFSFRKIPLVKNLLIALVWTLVTVYVPHGSNQLLPFFLIFLSLSIQSDIKDLEKDDFRTFAKISGHKTSIWIVNLLFLAGLLIFNIHGQLKIIDCIIVFVSFLFLQQVSLRHKSYGEVSDMVLIVVILTL